MQTSSAIRGTSAVGATAAQHRNVDDGTEADGETAADFLPDWAAHVCQVTDRATVEFARTAENVLKHGEIWNRRVAALALEPLKATAAWAAAPYVMNPFEALFHITHETCSAWLRILSAPEQSATGD